MASGGKGDGMEGKTTQAAAPTCSKPPATSPTGLKAAARGRLQRVVDLGPDGQVALLRSRAKAFRARRRFRPDDGSGVVPETWFAQLYEASDDPWDYLSSAYEARKYALTLAALPLARYHHAYEPGCSIGKLSTDLAQRCDHLVCSDYSPAAVELARRRLAHLPHVRVELHELPVDYPDEHFDLVVLGDLCMYLSPTRLNELAARVASSLVPGGHLVAVHGHHLSPDIFQSGDQVHARLRRQPSLRKLGGYRDGAFLLDIWERDG
jgi:SAM-dependent methyltransferase